MTKKDKETSSGFYLHSRSYSSLENLTNTSGFENVLIPDQFRTEPTPMKASINTWLNEDVDKARDVVTPAPFHKRQAAANETKEGKAYEENGRASQVDEATAENDQAEEEEEFVKRLQERTGFFVDHKKRDNSIWYKRFVFSKTKKASSRSVTGTGTAQTSASIEEIEEISLSDIIMKVVDPWEFPYYICLTISSVAILYNVFMIIARVTFEFLEEYIRLWVSLDYLADLIYIFDIAYQSRKGYLKDGILDTNYKTILRRYFLSWKCVVDIASVFPLELFALVPPHYSRTTFRFNRLLKLPRLSEWLDRSWRISRYPIMIRLGTLVLYFTICLHWNCCVYFEVSKRVGIGNDTWVVNYTGSMNENQSAGVGLYLSSMYWSSMRFTNIGEVPAPVTDGEMIFTIIDMLLAIAVFAGIFGSIEELLERAHEHRHNYHRWMDDVKKYMTRNSVPYELQRKVYVWMIHFWNRSHMLGGGTQSLAILPERLQAEINMNAHLDTLRRVRIFQDCEPGLLVALLNKLKLQMFNPGEYICRKGDVGKEMYIVKSGRLSVVGPDGLTVFATLTEGAAFGELSLLNISGLKTGNRRTASIRSNGYTDLFCLSKEDLWEALQDYGEARRVFVEKGREILIKDGLLDQADTADDFELLPQTSKYEAVREKADHLTVRMSAMIVGMGANLRACRGRIRYLEREIERHEEAYRRRKIQLADENEADLNDTDAEESP